MTQLVVNLAVEDDVSEAVGRRLLAGAGRSLLLGSVFKRDGFGYLRSHLHKFNELSKVAPVLLLTDLDKNPCPPKIIKNWFGKRRQNPSLIFRVAVREVESWLMADRAAFAAFLKIDPRLVTKAVESILDPKTELLRLAALSPDAKLRRRLCPDPATTAKVGPLYSPIMSEFARSKWDPKRASAGTPSLMRARKAIGQLVKAR